MTNNYNAADYAKDSDGAKLNEQNLKEMSETGRCNSCKYFHFGGYKCMKKDEKGNPVRADRMKITYTEKTQRGEFINVIKPAACKDFERKGKVKTEKETAE